MSEEVKYKPNQVRKPGDILEEVLGDLGMEHNEFLQVAAISPDYYWKIVDGSAILSTEAAKRLERWTKLPAWLWLRIDERWQEHQERMQEYVEQDQQD